MKAKHLVVALAAMVSAAAALNGCTRAQTRPTDTPQPTTTQVETLTEALTSWDGAELPDYPEGDSTQLTILKYTIPAHTSLDRHFHPIMSFGYLVQGELTVVAESGEEQSFHAGETIVETVNTWHHGENRGDSAVVLIVSYAGTTETPLVVKEGEGTPEDYLKE